MGIDKLDTRNVNRNEVPESALSWTQEVGRAGRDGMQACATILYRRSDVAHANAKRDAGTGRLFCLPCKTHERAEK